MLRAQRESRFCRVLEELIGSLAETDRPFLHAEESCTNLVGYEAGSGLVTWRPLLFRLTAFNLHFLLSQPIQLQCSN